jgi:hypothetical protein
MPDRDELDLLEAANPVMASSLPSAEHPRARALFERITMTDTIPESNRQPTTSRTRRPLVALATALALIALVGVVTLLQGDDGEARDDVAGPPSTEAPLSPDGPSLGSCVEVYDPTTLAGREIAFDGVVASTAGDAVTFTVKEWFSGGEGPEVTLEGASALAGLTSAGGSMSLEPGSRLLVAGDGGFAWACGFTQPFDPDVAEQWRRSFGS